MIKGIHHVGISVANLERSIEFYRDLLGMTVTFDPQLFAGELQERILGLKGARGRVAVVRKANLELELFEFEFPTPHSRDLRYPVSDHGISHFCIEVAGIDPLYERLSTAGVVFHCPPLDFRGEAKATYARDPDGNVFELLELTDPAQE